MTTRESDQGIRMNAKVKEMPRENDWKGRRDLQTHHEERANTTRLRRKERHISDVRFDDASPARKTREAAITLFAAENRSGKFSGRASVSAWNCQGGADNRQDLVVAFASICTCLSRYSLLHSSLE
jgi:hypothetical protein